MIRTVTAFATYLCPVSPYSVNIKRVRLANSSNVGTTGSPTLWLQLHEGVQNSPSDTDISPPANTAIPIDVEIPLAAAWGSGYDFSQDPIRGYNLAGNAVTPLIYVISSTFGTLTAATTVTSYDWAVDIEEYDASGLPPLVTKTVNSNASATNSLWADGTVKRLYELVVYQNSGATAYLKLFPTNTPTAGSMPLWEGAVPNNQTAPFARFKFGSGIPPSGFSPLSYDTSVHTGCILTLESAGGVNVAGNELTGWKYQSRFQ